MENPGKSMAIDLMGNGFSHANGVNVLHEDGAVKWLNGVPRYWAGRTGGVKYPYHKFELLNTTSRDSTLFQ
jgi:hypothetical protein